MPANLENSAVATGPESVSFCSYLKEGNAKEFSSEVAQSCLTLCDPWAVAYQVPPSMGFSRQEYTELYRKDLHEAESHDDVTTHLEPDILEYEVKWALGSITTSKASGSDGIPVELFQILKDDSMKVLHLICQQIWKTQ